jgi:hypothetical protein
MCSGIKADVRICERCEHYYPPFCGPSANCGRNGFLRPDCPICHGGTEYTDWWTERGEIWCECPYALEHILVTEGGRHGLQPPQSNHAGACFGTYETDHPECKKCATAGACHDETIFIKNWKM